MDLDVVGIGGGLSSMISTLGNVLGVVVAGYFIFKLAAMACNWAAVIGGYAHYNEETGEISSGERASEDEVSSQYEATTGADKGWAPMSPEAKEQLLRDVEHAQYIEEQGRLPWYLRD